MEEVLLLGHQRIDLRTRYEIDHVRGELGSVRGELTPVVVRLTVVVDEHGRIDPAARKLHRFAEGTLGAARDSDAFAFIRPAEVQKVPAVAMDRVRRPQQVLRRRGDLGTVLPFRHPGQELLEERRGLAPVEAGPPPGLGRSGPRHPTDIERFTVVNPSSQVRRRVHAVLRAAIAAVVPVPGSVDVDPTVGHHSCLRIRDVYIRGKQRDATVGRQVHRNALLIGRSNRGSILHRFSPEPRITLLVVARYRMLDGPCTVEFRPLLREVAHPRQCGRKSAVMTTCVFIARFSFSSGGTSSTCEATFDRWPNG
jgi:hypothetical protein